MMMDGWMDGWLAGWFEDNLATILISFQPLQLNNIVVISRLYLQLLIKKKRIGEGKVRDH